MMRVRHGIPRGFAEPQSGLARAKMCQWGMQAVPTGSPGESRGGQPDPLWRGSNVAPLRAFFCQAFFSTEKKAVRGGGVGWRRRIRRICACL